MKYYYMICIAAAIFLASTGIQEDVFAQTEITAEEIIKRVDENSSPASAISTTTMIIHKNKRVDTKIMKTWGIGKKNGFVEFQAPSRDKGTKYLRLEDNLWMYLPSVEKIVKISGHLLRQSMMGSDFSFEDALSRLKLFEDYDVEIIGEEPYENNNCFVLELTAKHKEVTYHRRKIWVDKEKFVAFKSEMYAKTGKLLKVQTVQKVEVIQGRYYPVHSTMVDKLKKNSRTEFIASDIQLDIEIPASIFTRRNLEKR